MAADICANCGAMGGDGDGDVKLKKCNGCLLVKYCGAGCQKAHRPSHKQACKKEAERLREEKLFAMPSEWEECPVCLLRMPFEPEKISYKPCCGQVVCYGCTDAEMMMRIKEGLRTPDQKVDFDEVFHGPCPFCRTPFPHEFEDYLDVLGKRVDSGDPKAMFDLGLRMTGPKPMGSVPTDPQRARELLLRSAKTGLPCANLSVGMFYYNGNCPEVFQKDVKKARQYFVVAALGGDPVAHAYLGKIEADRYNFRAASRHAMISAGCGYKPALENVLRGFKMGCVSKAEYGTTLRAYQAASDELTSEQRSAADEMSARTVDSRS